MRAMLEFEGLELLEQRIKKLPGKAEKAINDILHTKGLEIATHEMTNLLPVSRVNKRHARESKWYAHELGNLQFAVKSKGGAANKRGSFGYLVFPDEGRGPSNPIAQDFSGHALHRATPKILEEIHRTLDDLLKEEF